MRFFTAASALVAFAASAIAQETNPNFDPVWTPSSGDDLKVGDTVEITWQVKEPFNVGTVDISLIGGATQGTQVPLGTVATGVQNGAGKYSWTITSDLVGNHAVYGLKFLYQDGKTFQYSNPLTIKGGSSKTTSAVSSATTASATKTGSQVVVTDDATLTVTLTSCPPESATQHPNGTAPVWTTKVWNNTAVAPTVLPTGVLPTTSKAPGSSSIPSAPAPAPTSGAARVGAGLLAVVGAAALLL